jgi:hypothetical protein
MTVTVVAGGIEFCPSELGTREAADLPRSTAKRPNAADPSVAFECDKEVGPVATLKSTTEANC